MSETQSGIERQLRDLVMNGVEKAELSPDTMNRIEQRVLASLQPVTPLPGRPVLALGFLGIFAVVCAAVVGAIGFGGAVAMTFQQLAGLLAAVLGAAALTAASLSGEMAPGSRRIVRPSLLIGGLLTALLTLVVMLFPWEGGFSGGWHCFQTGFLSSLPAAGLVVLLLRRGTPLAWGAVGASAGLLAGLVGVAILHLGCSMIGAPHIMAGHLAVPLVGAAIGFMMGKALPRLVSTRD